MSSLSGKENEIIAVAASVAAGCVPCTAFHLRAAAAVGVGSDEIGDAVREAVRVRVAATSIMARHGGMSRPEAADEAIRPDGNRSLILELAAVAAAYAVGCTTSLDEHMLAARKEGAGDDQILTALKIACAVRDVAGQKAKAAAAVFLGADEAEAAECDCSDGDTMPSGDGPGGETGRGKAKSAGGCSCEK